MRPIHKLNDRRVRTVGVGLHGDGGGLLLQVTRGAADQFNRSWLFRFAIGGRERRMGLGAYPDVGLAAARERAASARKLVGQGIDPLAARDAQKASQAVTSSKTVTFNECVDGYINSHQAGWSPRHAQLWRRSIELHVTFGKLPVASIDTAIVMKDLEPLWRDIPDIASRVRGRIESILDWARVRKYRSGENPARWRGHLDHLLPARGRVHTVTHFAALPFTEIGTFVEQLREQAGTAARALEFLILTAGRTGEVLGARWDEIQGSTWVIPAERMKGGVEHKVPLSKPALRVIERQAKLRENEFVFPGQRRRHLSPMAMVAVVTRMGHQVTVHGFRSTFKDWVSDCTDYPREVAEAALAHAVPNAVEAAYRHGTFFEKRRQLMNEWAAYIEVPANNICSAA
jgi:integrase